MHIGAQRSEYSTASVDVLLQYNADRGQYLPFIPGSSLKGVLRSTARRILTTHGANSNMVDALFGSQNAAAKVRIRDSPGKSGLLLDERLHAATTYKKSGKFYEVAVQDKWVKPKTRLIDQENISQAVEFEFHIEVENARAEEIALLLRTLDEFRYKRAHIGGGVSRGHGFVSLSETRLSCTLLDGIKIKREEMRESDVRPLLRLDTNSRVQQPFNSFEAYAGAGSDALEGCIVCEAEAVCDTDFYLKGKEEPMVLGAGRPVIPGSTIKGFLRHLCCRTPVISGKPPRVMGYDESKLKWDVETVDRVFGTTDQRSKVLISEAFSDEIPPGDHIPKGSRLRCWIVFDNMEEQWIRTIIDKLRETNRLTGKTAARGRGPTGSPRLNRVHFEFRRAWKYHLQDPALDVTSML